jgi:hypothetical protein
MLYLMELEQPAEMTGRSRVRLREAEAERAGIDGRRTAAGA